MSRKCSVRRSKIIVFFMNSAFYAFWVAKPLSTDRATMSAPRKQQAQQLAGPAQAAAGLMHRAQTFPAARRPPHAETAFGSSSSSSGPPSPRPSSPQLGAAATGVESVGRRPGSTAHGPVLASLVDPERLDRAIPVLLSAKTSQGGKGLLCIDRVQSGGAQGSKIAALRLSCLHVSRYWGCPQSTQRILELNVPGREEEAGTVHLAMGDYDSMSRLAHMMGRDHFD